MSVADVDTKPGTLSRNPTTGEIVRHFPYQAPAEVEETLAAQAVALGQWQAMSMAARVACYRRVAATMRERKDALALMITTEMGKALYAAHDEVEKCALTYEWLAEHGPAILADEVADAGDGDKVYVSFLPIGTVLGVMPWNFPYWQVVRAAGPIMLSGNGFLLKHASNVMGCAYAMRDVYDASGFPAHLFSVLNINRDDTPGVINDPRIAAVTVTGSTGAGASVASTAGRAIKKSVLELGGSDPFIVLADADIDRAAEVGALARFQNAGQVCLAAKRFVLERPIAQEFTEKFLKAAAKVRVGNPLEPATTIGPMARGDLRDELHDQVQRSIAAGARLLLGGKPVDGPGYFYEPTVLGDVRPGMAVFDEETFGPVAALCVAEDVDDAIRLSNTSDYGLSSALWTSDVRRAAEIARRLETGGCFVNGFTATNPRIPVGGVKKSGYGRELSHFGLREFTNAQSVWIKAKP